MSEKRPVEDEVMSFIMGENEILRDYRTAANKRKQVQILADLNGCTKRQMAEFLISRGEEVDKRFVQKPQKREAVTHTHTHRRRRLVFRLSLKADAIL